MSKSANFKFCFFSKMFRARILSATRQFKPCQIFWVPTSTPGWCTPSVSDITKIFRREQHSWKCWRRSFSKARSSTRWPKMFLPTATIRWTERSKYSDSILQWKQCSNWETNHPNSSCCCWNLHIFSMVKWTIRLCLNCVLYVFYPSCNILD